jgi:diacylglycerol kinase family enzyme
VAGIGVIVNPHARANRRNRKDRVDRMQAILGEHGEVRVTQSLEELDEVAREFHREQIEILGICGGDGSDHCTLTAFHRAYGGERLPLLLPLRAGTINYVADDIGSPRGTPEQTLASVVRDHARGRAHVTTERDVIRINGTELGFVLSFGTAVNYLRAYYALPKQGPLAASRLLGKLMGSAMLGTHLARTVFQGVEADIVCDDETLPFRLYTFFFAATVERIALGFKPTYLGNRKRHFFHVLGGPIAARRLIRHGFRVHKGYATGDPDLYDNLGQRLAIRFARPTHYMLDGDIVGPVQRVDVDVPMRVELISE